MVAAAAASGITVAQLASAARVPSALRASFVATALKGVGAERAADKLDIILAMDALAR